jgi:serine O-acetyltransferase
VAGDERGKGLPAEALVIEMLERIREDVKMHEGKWSSQGLWVMVPYRFGCWRYTVRPAWVRKPLSLVYRVMKTVSQVLTGIDLPCEVKIGRRFRIEHFGGIIVSGDAVLGDDVVIRNGVTIGLKRRDDPGSPVIGNRVDIGAGAKILGKIRIGDDVLIGANAVVISDVPANSIAVGIPARIVPRKRSVSNQAGGVLKANRVETAEVELALLSG